MDEVTFELLLNRARDQWLRYERYRLGFETATRRCRQRAQWLAWATILLGFSATVVGGLAAARDPAPAALVIVGTILAAATTAAAAIRQTFSWESKAQQRFAQHIEVGNIQRSIQDYLETVARRAKAEDPTFLSVVEGRFQKLLDAESEDCRERASEAAAAWGESFVSKLKLMPLPGPAASPLGAAPDELDFELEQDEAEAVGLQPAGVSDQ